MIFQDIGQSCADFGHIIRIGGEAAADPAKSLPVVFCQRIIAQAVRSDVTGNHSQVPADAAKILQLPDDLFRCIPGAQWFFTAEHDIGGQIRYILQKDILVPQEGRIGRFEISV